MKIITYNFLFRIPNKKILINLVKTSNIIRVILDKIR